MRATGFTQTVGHHVLHLISTWLLSFNSRLNLTTSNRKLFLDDKYPFLRLVSKSVRFKI